MWIISGFICMFDLTCLWIDGWPRMCFMMQVGEAVWFVLSIIEAPRKAKVRLSLKGTQGPPDMTKKYCVYQELARNKAKRPKKSTNIFQQVFIYIYILMPPTPCESWPEVFESSTLQLESARRLTSPLVATTADSAEDGLRAEGTSSICAPQAWVLHGAGRQNQQQVLGHFLFRVDPIPLTGRAHSFLEIYLA